MDMTTITEPKKKKKVIFLLEPALIKDLKRISVEKEVTQNDLFVEGVKLILEKYKGFLNNK